MCPEIIQRLIPVEVKEGGVGKFQCRILAKPAPDIEWYKDDQLLDESDRVKFENKDGVRVLTITDISPFDEAEYKILTRNPLGTATCSAELLVEEFVCKPELMQPMEDVEVKAGEDCCFCVRVKGDVNVDWYKNDKLLEDAGHVVIVDEEDGETFTLAVEEATVEDSGVYKCVASNKAGKVTCSASLNITLPKPEGRKPWATPTAVSQGKESSEEKISVTAAEVQPARTSPKAVVGAVGEKVELTIEGALLQVDRQGPGIIVPQEELTVASLAPEDVVVMKEATRDDSSISTPTDVQPDRTQPRALPETVGKTVELTVEVSSLKEGIPGTEIIVPQKVPTVESLAPKPATAEDTQETSATFPEKLYWATDERGKRLEKTAEFPPEESFPKEPTDNAKVFKDNIAPEKKGKTPPLIKAKPKKRGSDFHKGSEEDQIEKLAYATKREDGLPVWARRPRPDKMGRGETAERVTTETKEATSLKEKSEKSTALPGAGEENIPGTKAHMPKEIPQEPAEEGREPVEKVGGPGNKLAEPAESEEKPGRQSKIPEQSDRKMGKKALGVDEKRQQFEEKSWKSPKKQQIPEDKASRPEEKLQRPPEKAPKPERKPPRPEELGWRPKQKTVGADKLTHRPDNKTQWTGDAERKTDEKAEEPLEKTLSAGEKDLRSEGGIYGPEEKGPTPEQKVRSPEQLTSKPKESTRSPNEIPQGLEVEAERPREESKKPEEKAKKTLKLEEKTQDRKGKLPVWAKHEDEVPEWARRSRPKEKPKEAPPPIKPKATRKPTDTKKLPVDGEPTKVVPKQTAPKFVTDLEEAPSVIHEGEDFNLKVKLEGIPKPTVERYKDDVKVLEQPRRTIKGDGDSCELIVKNAVAKDSGIYKCVVTNDTGSSSKIFELEVKGMSFFVYQPQDISTSYHRATTSKGKL